MAMGIQQQQQHSPHGGSPSMFASDLFEYGNHQQQQQQYDDAAAANDRQPRDAARNGGSGGRFRRPRSPSLDDDSRFTTAPASEQNSSEAALQEAVLAQAPHQQQRVVPAGQSGARGQVRAAGPRNGPPSMANPGQNRRSYPQPPSVQAQLPPYENSDGWSPAPREPPSASAAAAGGGGYSRRRTERHARRKSSSSGGPSAPDMTASSAPQMSGGAENQATPRASQQKLQQLQQLHQNPESQRLRPPTPPHAGGLASLSVGDEINRLQSPSISKSVLEPLQRKMLEYHTLMEEAQGQMMQLDDEIRALQERRRQAEQRFVDAKAKHDEYERQHLDVERALRGDYGPAQQLQPPQPQVSQQHHQMYADSPPRAAVPRPASSIMSYDERPMSGRSSIGPKKGKFRISLFGR